MYTTHFGFDTLPFENVPDPKFFFESGDYHRVLQRMRGYFAAGKGLMAVAGPIGSGKTTLSQKLMADLPETAQLVWLAEPPSDAAGLLSFIARELGLEQVSEEKVFAMGDIRSRLLKGRDGGISRCLVIIDEAHLASDDTLEGIRLLNNLEVGSQKLLQILLLGQQEMVDKLARPELEAFRQRIAAMEIIGKMHPPKLRQYILHRLKVAGASDRIFTETALEMVSISTGGIPRVTNSLCDRALRIAWEMDKPGVDAPEVHQAAIELGLGRLTLPYVLKQRSEQTEQAKMEEKDVMGPNGSADDNQDTAREVIQSTGLPGSSREGQVIGNGFRLITESSGEATGRAGQSDLQGPLMFLLISLIALAVSLWFYCSRVGSASSESCLGTLMGSLL
jgi:general secretion pathway protein A